MTPRETFNLATAIQRLALLSYPIKDDTALPNDTIALCMGKIAGLCHTIKSECLNLDAMLRTIPSEDPK